jgi:hypothetical protein
MFYWLDSFAHCLSPFFYHGVGSNPPPVEGTGMLILNRCEGLFVKKWRGTTVETGTLSIV